MESWAVAKKALSQCCGAPAPIRVSSQRPLAPSVASVTSVANGKDDPRGCAQISRHLPFSSGKPQKNPS